KKPGKPADKTSPYTLPIGSTVVDLATQVHRELGETLKTAKVWGTGVFDGQAVPRDHVLHDQDVVELHA
ncbi:MAG: TGS domain-containing protein, partial [Planctomycetia bacterium]|nr:TGS domain-containing protein [Planctomycetia bacterium]